MQALTSPVRFDEPHSWVRVRTQEHWVRCQKEEQEQGTKATIGDLREQQVSYTLDGLVTQLIVTGRNRRATSVTETPKVSVDSTAMKCLA